MGLPTISIVVPNYNGGKTIEATLRSIIDQQYPDLELVVIDGGSKDDSVEIIRKYERYITYWRSEKDRGQSHAINKGFARCTGEVVNWLCSDDLFCPGSLETVGRTMADPELDMCIGKCELVFPGAPERNGIMWPTAEQVERTAVLNYIPQPSCFYRRRAIARDELVREDFHFAMDQELWCYLLSRNAKWKIIDDVLSVTMQDGTNKTMQGDYRAYVERDKIFRQYWKHGGVPQIPRWFRTSVGPWSRYLERQPNGLRAAMARRGIDAVARFQRLWRGTRGS